MKKVYLLLHSYDQVFGEDEEIVREETKLIGIYSSYENAAKTKREFLLKKGFARFPEECFYIDEYELNNNHWVNGFVDWKDSTLAWSEREKNWRSMLPKEKDRMIFGENGADDSCYTSDQKKVACYLRENKQDSLNKFLGQP